MASPRTKRSTFGAVLLILLSVFLVAAIRQHQTLNLSATAGGQMPYLVYADRIAREGLIGHFGDRNRMPAIPVVASLVHHEDWEIFHQRASVLAIVISTVLAVGLWIVARRVLSPWAGAMFATVIAFAVILPQSSFLQADVPYYALLFLTWLAILRLVDRPGVLRALIVGALIAITYLVKASILLSIPILAGVLILRGICAPPADEPVAIARSRRKQFFLSAAIAPAVFLLLVSPYLKNNHEQFGRLFYNVNTTFFIWCDSWAEAQRFSERYQIDRHFPEAPPEQIPGPVNYLNTHSAQQIAQRIVYGVRTLFVILLTSPVFKYLVVVSAFVVIALCRNRQASRDWAGRHKWQIALTLTLLLAYGLAYSWYVLVAYGDRFVLSLVPIILFGCLHYLDRTLIVGSSGIRFVPAISLFLLFIGLADGVRAAITPQPPNNFVRFYYDETREEFRRGNLVEARRGFEGVVTLDPGFAAAHRELGMIALAQNRPAEAIESLGRAAALEPGWGDVHNSLGSALLQAGRLAEAVAILERAVELDPASPPAWYNLCGALFQLQELERAHQCLSQLETLSPPLAERIRKAFITQNDPESIK